MSTASAMVHGGSGSTYVHYGCRCDECVAANTARINRRKQERLAARVVVDGRLVAPGPRRHGTKQTYGNWGCRCFPCTAANSVYLKAYRSARRSGDTTQESAQ